MLTTVEWNGKSFNVVVADLSRADLRVHLKGAVPPNAIVLTNAGIFDSVVKPTGLLVEDGVERSPLNLKDGQGNFYLKPNGVFFVGEEGARVIESSEYPVLKKGVKQATQSGPLLVRKGVVHEKFSEGSQNALVRSGIGVNKEGHVVMAISKDPVTFFDFATLFRDALSCPDALYLDGVISTLRAPSAGLKKWNRSAFAGVISLSVHR